MGLSQVGSRRELFRQRQQRACMHINSSQSYEYKFFRAKELTLLRAPYLSTVHSLIWRGNRYYTVLYSPHQKYPNDHNNQFHGNHANCDTSDCKEEKEGGKIGQPELELGMEIDSVMS